MKTGSPLFYCFYLFILGIFSGSCSDKDEFDAVSASDYTLQVVESETRAPRSHEPVLITGFGAEDKVAYRRNYVTDGEGKVFLKLDAGKYRAAFAFLPGKEADNFLNFEISPQTAGEIIMEITDKREYYACTLTVVDSETGACRSGEPIRLITLDKNGNEAGEKELTTDAGGKAAFRVVAGRYRARFAYEKGGEPDNTYDFGITAEGEKDLVMEVRPNLSDDGKPAGYVYFEDNFDWIGTEFGGSDYMDGKFPTTEKRFTAITEPELLQKVEESGWTITGAVYARIGYVKYGLGNDTKASNGKILTPCLPVAEKRFTNVRVAFKAARFVGKTGALDTENTVNVLIEGAGSFDPDKEIKAMELFIGNTAYNEWDELETVIYNASSTTQVSIGKTKKLSKGRFFLDDVSVTKHSKAEAR